MSQLLCSVWILVFGFVLAGPVYAEEMLRYAGATTLQRYFMPEAARLFADETAIRFRIDGGNTDPGLQALLEGEVDLAGAGRLLTAEEKGRGLVEHFLGWDVLAVVVHSDNPIDDLDYRQLERIFSGHVANWKEVGGTDTPILVVTCPKGSGMRASVQDLVLQDRAYLEREIISAIVSEADQQVGMFRNAITVISRSMVDARTVKIVKVAGIEPTAANIAAGQYLLAKPLTLVTRGVPKGDLSRFMDLVKSTRGKAILQKHFVPAD